MKDGDEGSARVRGMALALSILLVLALVGDSLIPAVVEAKPQPGSREPHVHRESKPDSRKPGKSHRRGGVNAQVVGGTVVPQGKFTFMAAITEDEFAFCGGTLIDPSFVLTAAHCVTDFDGNELDPTDFEVWIGKADLNAVQAENRFGVVDLIAHDEYDPDTNENDVAVLELDRPVPGDIAQVLHFVGAGETRFGGVGQDAVTAGWGLTSEEGESSDLLLEADLDIVSDSSCEAAYAENDPEVNPALMICAAAAGRDSCQGDSGGPLMSEGVVGFTVKKGKKKKHKKRKKTKIPIVGMVQTGIVSFGEGCARPDFPGVYTQVSAPGINDFIVDVVRGE